MCFRGRGQEPVPTQKLYDFDHNRASLEESFQTQEHTKNMPRGPPILPGATLQEILN